MTSKQGGYPAWIAAYLWFTTAVSAMFAVVVYLDASLVWDAWEAIDASGATDLDGPAGLFAARNLGTAAMGLYALLHRSRPMLESYLVFRVVVDGLDGVHALVGGNTPVIALGFGAAVVEAVMLVRLRRQSVEKEQV